MAAIWRFLAPWLLVWGGTAQASGDALVTIRMMPDAVHATIELDRPVHRFAFAEAAVVREGDLEILTPGLTLKNDEVTAASPFRRFNVSIGAATSERDAAYPAHYRVGEGGMVYAPALRGDEANWRTRFRFELQAGQIRLPASRSAETGFVFIGPPKLRSEYPDLVLIADQNTPAWLVELSRAAQSAAIAHYSRSTGVRLPDKPLLVIGHWQTGRNTYIGDVTPGLVTTVRFRGPAWERADEAASKLLQTFLFHETFHLWNGAYASHDSETPTWLHEGGAEYAALLAGLDTGALTDAEVRAKLSEALQRCRSGLEREGDKGLAQLRFLSNQVRYPCGMVIQWAADLHLRKASKGGRNIMDAWAETLRVARSRSSDEYTLADFYSSASILDADFFAPSTLLVGQSGPGRWEALPAALNALGAEVELAPSTAQGRRQSLLVHLLGQNCNEESRFGFTVDAGVVKLDSPETCGPLAGNPALASVEGGALFDISPETYAAVQTKCAADAVVSIATADGRTIWANCAMPLGEAPRNFVVKQWRSPSLRL